MLTYCCLKFGRMAKREDIGELPLQNESQHLQTQGAADVFSKCLFVHRTSQAEDQTEQLGPNTNLQEVSTGNTNSTPLPFLLTFL